MWTNENRGRYDRSRLRYPSDLTDEEWALVEPFIPPARHGGNKRTVNVRAVVNGLMYVLSTGCQWRAIPKNLPPRSTVYDYFDLWSWDGTLDGVPKINGRVDEPGAAAEHIHALFTIHVGGPRSDELTQSEAPLRAADADFLVADADLVHHQPGIGLAKLWRAVAQFVTQEHGDLADLVRRNLGLA